MTKKILLMSSRWITFVLVFATFNFQKPTEAQIADTSKQLFRLSESPRNLENSLLADKVSLAAVRESRIELQTSANNLSTAKSLTFPLFDGKTYQAIRQANEGVEVRAADDVTWRGTIEGVKDSSVTVTVKHNAMSGLIIASSQVYEIVPKDNTHVLAQIDQGKFPECGGEIQTAQHNLQQSSLNQNNGQPAVGVDSSDRIDVLVVYTPAVKTALGGAPPTEAFIQQAVAVSNTAYLNSRVRQRLRLAAAIEVAYTESGNFSTDLTWLRTNAEVAALREQYKADLVDIIVNGGNACGIGYLMTNVNTSFAPYGFSVTARSCAVGNLTFAHELGHNMGSAHNPENAGASTFPFSFGHYVNGSFRTVMSYTDPCTAGCTRVPHFSNPLVLYNNIPTGVENARDNARSLNLTADTITNLFYSGSSLTLATPNGTENWSRNLPRIVRWTSDNIAGNVRIELSRDGGQTFQTLIAETPNDGEEAVIVRGRAIKSARLRVVSVSNPNVSDSSVNDFFVR